VIVTLSLPDDLYQEFVDRGGASPNKALVQHIQRFREFTPEKRALIFTDAQRKRLEGLFGEGIDSTSMEKFLLWLERRSTINVEGVEVRLSPAQMKAAEAKAKFWSAKGGEGGASPTAAFVAEEVRRQLYHLLGA
jgi:hypothetical protein